jgi:hypothetical protein
MTWLSPTIYISVRQRNADDLCVAGLWTMPVAGGVGKVFRIGTQPMNASVQAYYNAISPDNLPAADWQLQIQLGFLFPK